MRTPPSVRALLAAVVVLGAGFALGVLVERHLLGSAAPGFGGPPLPPLSDRVALFQKKLALTAEQSAQVRAILSATDEEARKIHSTVVPRLDAIRQRTENDIRAVLSPEQLNKYNALLESFERMRPKGPFGEPGPPGHMGELMGPPPHLLKQLDEDGDGSLSRAELEADRVPFAAFLLERFDDLDTNGDAVLSLEEMAAGGPPRLHAP